jgi:beta-phosphoglucomutase-like phosphatase (HAD superfamily)
VIRAEGLRPRPAPDVAGTACRLLRVEPERTIAFTHTSGGVAAAHAAGLPVVGVGTGRRAEVLAGFGAGRVVPSLASLLDPALTAAAA